MDDDIEQKTDHILYTLTKHADCNHASQHIIQRESAMGTRSLDQVTDHVDISGGL